jgi:branched-subunit amino acid ABC-type transport system permease component
MTPDQIAAALAAFGVPAPQLAAWTLLLSLAGAALSGVAAHLAAKLPQERPDLGLPYVVFRALLDLAAGNYGNAKNIQPDAVVPGSQRHPG